ncbi:hypothetical protein [Terrabacter carboxydivorans]|uniref:Uncharacterized protein n=1 Tax=Terrabacter carboxydivorans TaxID=619730 RepID=A0ABP5ZQV8_9MICO
MLVRRLVYVLLGVLSMLALLVSMDGLAALAKGGGGLGGGGTAKPPPVRPAPGAAGVTRSFPALVPPVFTGDPSHSALHQFDVTGFIQDATVTDNCPAGVDALHDGGNLLVNGLTVVVPCNSVIQMPASSSTWRGFVDPPADQPSLPISLKQLGSSPGTFPSFEIHVVGNTVAGRYVAGLVTVSQQSLNQGQGVITSIDYATGQLHVGAGVGAPDQAIVEINDPEGRFGIKHSVDARFRVDDQNPTIHAATGYPMCIPRQAPVRDAVTNALVTDNDPLCPQANRPTPVAHHCRDFIDDGLGFSLPKGLNLVPPSGNPAFCGHFVMPPVSDTSGSGMPPDPDPRQQAPFEVGDYITFAGTLLRPAGTSPSLVSAHTVEASVGIFTSHGTLPSYLAIGQFGVGSADPSTVSVNGAAQETVDRMFLTAETTDVTTPVDIYFPDIDPSTGAVSYRWITPFEMSGESNPEITPDGPGAPIGGGITTQFTGPQSQRVRLRARKAPPGLLTSPTRDVLVVSRLLCNPDTTGTPSSVSANSTYHNIATSPDCLTGQVVANGLASGRYEAPNFDFIFPENVQVGDTVVPNDLWALGFLSNGEGGPHGQGPLYPPPW